MPKAKKRTTNQNREARIIKVAKLDFEPTYKEYEKLARYLNDRAKIQGRKRSGLTAKDQRRITIAIKRARHLGLLPFSSRV